MASNTRSIGAGGSSKKPQSDKNSRETKEVPQEKGYTRLLLPTTKGKARDPSVLENWKNSVPTTEDEMQQWMVDQRNLCYAHLKYCKGKAEDSSIGEIKDSLERGMREEWKKWEDSTDIKTGEIYDETRRTNVENSMRAKYRDLAKKYDATTAKDAHKKYRNAQEHWEGKRMC
jgi:hypothetical protein